MLEQSEWSAKVLLSGLLIKEVAMIRSPVNLLLGKVIDTFLLLEDSYELHVCGRFVTVQWHTSIAFTQGVRVGSTRNVVVHVFSNRAATVFFVMIL